MDTHLIPCSARALSRHGEYRALCGAIVDSTQHAAHGEPTCAECKRIDEDDAQSMLRLQQATPDDFGGQPVRPREWFDPCAGYTPRGARR